jgi:hypothetical protein
MANEKNSPDPRSDHSAENSEWWPDFVTTYGQVSLRELARRYGTNPRRLRRAAQRSGLTAEPESIRSNIAQLGQVADSALARDLGVTEEAIVGARRRRGIEPFAIPVEPTPPPPPPPPRRSERLLTPNTPPRPRRKRRFEPPPEVVVVRKGSRAQVLNPLSPAPLAAVPDLPSSVSVRPNRSQPNDAPIRRTRRRIIKSDERIELPELEAKPARVRRAQAKKPPVTIVFDRKTATGAIPAAPATSTPPKPAVAAPTPEPGKSVVSAPSPPQPTPSRPRLAPSLIDVIAPARSRQKPAAAAKKRQVAVAESPSAAEPIPAIKPTPAQTPIPLAQPTSAPSPSVTPSVTHSVTHKAAPAPKAAPALQPTPSPVVTPASAAQVAPKAPAHQPLAAEIAAERMLWTARIQSTGSATSLYILAVDLVTAARRAAAEGPVLSLQLVQTL